jgi:NAD+ synthase
MTGSTRGLSRGALDIDAAAAADQIERAIARIVSRTLHRQGAVVGVSGGVDSAVCVTLASRALGAGRVLAVLMPERDFPPEGTDRGRAICEGLGVPFVVEDVGGALSALGCYDRRDVAIARLFSEYGPGYRQKISLGNGLAERDRLSYFRLTVESPTGERRSARMPADVYLQVVAATNMKQRVRALIAHFHAERLNHAVVGTANRLEHQLGFFVRGGDGLADLKPIAHLYKSQVLALARYLGVAEEVVRMTPSTNTYSLPQTQEEFYFGLPLEDLDLLLYAFEHGVPAEEVGTALDLDGRLVERVYRDIVSKRRAASRLNREAVLVEPVDVPIPEG